MLRLGFQVFLWICVIFTSQLQTWWGKQLWTFILLKFKSHLPALECRLSRRRNADSGDWGFANSRRATSILERTCARRHLTMRPAGTNQSMEIKLKIATRRQLLVLVCHLYASRPERWMDHIISVTYGKTPGCKKPKTDRNGVREGGANERLSFKQQVVRTFIDRGTLCAKCFSI